MESEFESAHYIACVRAGVCAWLITQPGGPEVGTVNIGAGSIIANCNARKVLCESERRLRVSCASLQCGRSCLLPHTTAPVAAVGLLAALPCHYCTR